MSWKLSNELMSSIRHYAKFPATGVSLRQMVQFGENPSVGMSQEPNYKRSASLVILTQNLSGTMYRAAQFLGEELPIRLAHRVMELDELPDGLSEMPSIMKVKNWYAESFEVSHTVKAFKVYKAHGILGSYNLIEALHNFRGERTAAETSPATTTSKRDDPKPQRESRAIRQERWGRRECQSRCKEELLCFHR